MLWPFILPVYMMEMLQIHIYQGEPLLTNAQINCTFNQNNTNVTVEEHNKKL